MERIEKGFFDRMKKIQTVRMLGTGMDVGELNLYVHEICFLLLLNVFKRELTEDSSRTRFDLIQITEGILMDMGVSTSRENVERIVDGTIYYKDPNKQEQFNCTIFNEETKSREKYKFRYLKEDREHSHWEAGGSTVYMLTEEAQEMIFITREILEEFGFDIEQFYTLQLIKTGNFNNAHRSVDNLIARVRTLIRREKDYREDIIRNPQVIFFDRKRNKKGTEEEIRKQFEEEQKVFDDMFSWKSRFQSLPDDKKLEAEIMFDNLERARILHNQLAKLVVENMAYEVEIRVKYPESFWRTSNVSFKKDIWENTIVKNGLVNFDILEAILNPMFSPKTEFIFPLDWVWDEQIVQKYSDDYEEQGEFIEEEEHWQDRKIDWDILVEVWKDVFDELLKNGSFSIEILNCVSSKLKYKWLFQKENLDIFMMFVITEVVLKTDNDSMDERLKLFSLLCQKDEKYEELAGKRIKSKLEVDKEGLKWDEVHISPYTIFIDEEVRG